MTWKLLSWKVIPSALHFRGHRWKRREERIKDSLEQKKRRAEECRMLSVVPLFYHQTEVRGLVVMAAVVMAAGLSNKHKEEMSSQPVKWRRRGNRCLKCGLTFALRSGLVVETQHCDASVFKYFSQIILRHLQEAFWSCHTHFVFWTRVKSHPHLTFNLI